jgi:hypothetical protein
MEWSPLPHPALAPASSKQGAFHA